MSPELDSIPSQASPQAFNPLNRNRVFNIGMIDYVEFLLLPPL